MEYLTFCDVCKVTPIDTDRLSLSSEPRSRFCSENCRKEAYVLGLVDRERCRHCGISPRLILSNGRKVDYCGMACRKEAEKLKSSGNSKSYNYSGSNKRSSVNLMLTPDKPVYQPKSKPTTLIQNNGLNIKASKSYDSLLSSSAPSRPNPKRSSTIPSDSPPTPTKKNSSNSSSSLLTAPPHHNFQPRSFHNSLSLRSPTKRRSINDVDPLFSVKPPSPRSNSSSNSSNSNLSSRSPTPIKRRSINDIDPLISITPPSQNSNNNFSPHLPTLTKRRSTNAIEPLISISSPSQNSYNQLNNSSSFINPPPPSHSRRPRPTSHVPTINRNGHTVPLISLIPPSYSTTHTNYNNYITKKV
ncbi:22953_t:CDS:2 [Dentiscutata erythropus]|uniref:22953_t:CDS:1 n=1 Tax=Dentiscutata erythropus TaxID=1348616 RepID=A0A9N8W9P0_9GLOM|nr:22953_t:CDS:2 [Dentiscutata erythropus]